MEQVRNFFKEVEETSNTLFSMVLCHTTNVSASDLQHCHIFFVLNDMIFIIYENTNSFEYIFCTVGIKMANGLIKLQTVECI